MTRNAGIALAAWMLVASVSPTALAHELVIEPNDPNLAPTTFAFRYDAVLKFPGCYRYDFLQRTWFPSSWVHDASFRSVDGDYSVFFERTFAERFCASQLGLYNYVNLTWTDPQTQTVYRGVMQVDARGTQTFDEVECRLADDDAIECDSALVRFEWGRPTTIVVHFDP